MSEVIYAIPDFTKKVRRQTSEKADGNADVHKTTDNVNIYDNYLAQGSSSLELQDSTTEDQQKANSGDVPSGGRNLHRPAVMSLVPLCLLFLAGVVVLVVLLIHHKGLNADLTRASDELHTSYGEAKSINANLSQKIKQLDKDIDHLKVIERNLTKERDELQKQQESSRCPDNWMKFGDSCYSISDSMKDWTGSRSSCEDGNAQLVIISSEQEQKFLNSFRLSFWIGLGDAENEGVWKWVNGSLATETYWRRNQPDDFNKNEDCVFHEADDNLKTWNDLDCKVSKYFICEKLLVST